jgi:DNA/RNA-binding domain of Phe-tRNA-synthetase-like protein
VAFALHVSPALAGKARLGFLVLEGVTVREADESLAAEIEAEAARRRQAHAGRPSGSVPGVEEARRLYKAIGLDPTKTRPSNESLLRRVLRGDPFPRVNTLVDALNLSSLREQLPFGLYDLDRVEGPVEAVLGGPGEGYEGIRKGPVSLEGKLALRDERGPFGNPSSDSARTQVRPETRRALVVCFAPATIGAARLEEVLDRTAATLARSCGGTAAERGTS